MSEAEAHASRVIQTAQCGRAATRSRLAASWRRSLVTHALDPVQQDTPVQYLESELTLLREAAELLFDLAGPELDALSAQVRLSGCAVLLTDINGVVLDCRTAPSDQRAFNEWGLRPGAVWSEASQGTNGIGTCLVEGRPITIHRDQHFLCRNIAMSCIGAPIFGPDGALLGALDISSARADSTAHINCLLTAAANRTASLIEAALFRAHYPKMRSVMVQPGEHLQLLAIDQDDLVVGATRAARRAFGLPTEGDIAARPANALLGQGQSVGGMARAEHAVLRRALIRSGGNATAAASALGISRATLYRRMKRVGLKDRGA